MNIVIGCPWVGNGLGGLERVGIDLCNNMVNRGHNIALLFKGDGNPLYDFDKRIVLINQLENFSEVLKRIEIFNAEVLLGMSSGFLSIYFYKIALFLEIPFCIHESTHHRRFCGPHWARQRKISFEQAVVEREVICSQAFRIRHVLNHSVDFFPDYIKSQVRVFPNPVNLCFDRGKKVSQTKSIINIGGLKKVKNIFPLLNAFKILGPDYSDWVLKICGSGFHRENDYQKEIFDFVKKNNLESKVLFTGDLQDLEMKQEYLKAEIHVILSLDENFSMCLAESMLAGVPSVGYCNSYGVSTLIKHGKTGYLVSQDQPTNGLVEALQILMENEKMRMEFGENAKQIAMREFNPEKIYDKWEEIFFDSQQYVNNTNLLLESQLKIAPEKALYANRMAKKIAMGYNNHN